jgi:hypothetical protein
LLAGNKPLKESKGRFKISIDALYILTLLGKKKFLPVGCHQIFGRGYLTPHNKLPDGGALRFVSLLV